MSSLLRVLLSVPRTMRSWSSAFCSASHACSRRSHDAVHTLSPHAARRWSVTRTDALGAPVFDRWVFLPAPQVVSPAFPGFPPPRLDFLWTDASGWSAGASQALVVHPRLARPAYLIELTSFDVALDAFSICVLPWTLSLSPPPPRPPPMLRRHAARVSRDNQDTFRCPCTVFLLRWPLVSCDGRS